MLPSVGSARNSCSQSFTAFGASTVSASVETTRSASWQYRHQPAVRAPDLRCPLPTVSKAVTPGYEEAMAKVSSVELSETMTMRSSGRSWARRPSIDGPDGLGLVVGRHDGDDPQRPGAPGETGRGQLLTLVW